MVPLHPACLTSMVIILVVPLNAQINLPAVTEERQWTYEDGGATQSLQADTVMNVGYIESAEVKVLVDYNSKESSFLFKGDNPRCLITSLNSRLFPESALKMEMLGAQLYFKKTAGDSSTFPKYMLKSNSQPITMKEHFNTRYSDRKISSDLIVEVCEDAAGGVMYTATVEPFNAADLNCGEATKANILQSVLWISC